MVIIALDITVRGTILSMAALLGSDNGSQTFNSRDEVPLLGAR